MPILNRLRGSLYGHTVIMRVEGCLHSANETLNVAYWEMTRDCKVKFHRTHKTYPSSDMILALVHA